MLDDTHPESLQFLYELREAADLKSKPIVVWAGAGVGQWAGYPGWQELAEGLHRDFSRKVPSYDRTRGAERLAAGSLPEVFSLLKAADPLRYHRTLTERLGGAAAKTGVLRRFTNDVKGKSGGMVISTNVDGSLDTELGFPAFGRDALDVCLNRAFRREPFLCKLHGAIAQPDSIVFTKEELAGLAATDAVASHLRTLFEQCVVVFVGYSLRDEHVLTQVLRADRDATSLGAGPHFLLTDATRAGLPPSVRQIIYRPVPHRDHRTQLQVLEEIGQKPGATHVVQAAVGSSNARSAHVLSMFFPAGTWQTTQTVTVASGATFTVGQGFVDAELDSHRTTALHDLAVGLVCFETTHVPIEYWPMLLRSVPLPAVSRALESGALRLMKHAEHDAIGMPNDKSITGGSIGSIVRWNSDGSAVTVMNDLERGIRIVPGRESEGRALLGHAESCTDLVAAPEPEHVVRAVRALLLLPSIRSVLGISHALNVESIPKWAVFPVLRLASVVRLGLACSHLGVRSVRFDLGSNALAARAFAASRSREIADFAAAYAVAGRFDCDLGTLLTRDPRLFDVLLQFRESSEARKLREHVHAALIDNSGADVATAVDASLGQAVPQQALQAARDAFTARMVLTPSVAPYPVLFERLDLGESSLKRWRARSRTVLEEVTRAGKLGPYARCPCGSGESLRFCCDEATNT